MRKLLLLCTLYSVYSVTTLLFALFFSLSFLFFLSLAVRKRTKIFCAWLLAPEEIPVVSRRHVHVRFRRFRSQLQAAHDTDTNT